MERAVRVRLTALLDDMNPDAAILERRLDTNILAQAGSFGGGGAMLQLLAMVHDRVVNGWELNGQSSLKRICRDVGLGTLPETGNDNGSAAVAWRLCGTDGAWARLLKRRRRQRQNLTRSVDPNVRGSAR